MKAGKLKHKIVIQRDVGTTLNADGGHVPSWTTFLTTWAAVEPLTSREVVQGGQQIADATHRITLRYRTGIHSAMRATWQGRTFNFSGPPLNTEEANRELVILAKEVETTT
jgi:SPP1 family predicted phage head-tail adaptor